MVSPILSAQIIKPYDWTGISLRFYMDRFHFVLNVLLAMVLRVRRTVKYVFMTNILFFHFLLPLYCHGFVVVVPQNILCCHCKEWNKPQRTSGKIIYHHRRVMIHEK